MSTNKPTNNPTNEPKENNDKEIKELEEARKKMEKERKKLEEEKKRLKNERRKNTDTAQEEASKILKDLKEKQVLEDAEPTLSVILKTITNDMTNFCVTLLGIVLIYYFYKGYARKTSMYGGGINNSDIISKYTYE